MTEEDSNKIWMQMYPLFSTPVIRDRIEYNIDMEFVKNLSYKRYRDNSGFGSETQKLLLLPEFSEIKKQIEFRLNYYLFEILKFKQGTIKHASSWINYHKPGDASAIHNHTNSCYSGILYLKTAENCGKLWFSYPSCIPTYVSSTITPELGETNIYNSYNFAFNPIDGELFLFPSHLSHFTGINESNEDRYCIAFNYFLDGYLGGSTNELNITVNEYGTPN